VKKTPLSVAIVENHAMMRMGLTAFLNVINGVKVVMEVDSAKAAIEQLVNTEAKLIIVDLQLPNASGIDLVGHVRRHYPEMRVLMISGVEEAASLAMAKKIGAHGLVTKSRLIEDIDIAIKKMISGEDYWPQLGFGHDEKSAITSVQPLSPRELEVLRLVGAGKTSKEIARLLSVSVRTIDVHRANVKRKLRVKNTSELVKYAVVLSTFGGDNTGGESN
jgi:two-component system, NarL family, response regulator NreC